MKAMAKYGVILAAWGAMACVAMTQPPRQGPGGPGGGPPRRFELGRVLPPHVVGSLKLSKEQEDQIGRLEKEVKERLAKILTPAQIKQVNEAPSPFGPPPGGPGGPGGPQGGPDRPMPPNIPPKDKDKADSKPTASTDVGGIQWFATLERGLAEAKATGKPIMLLSAAPHCGGVSGIW